MSLILDEAKLHSLLKVVDLNIHKHVAIMNYL